MLNEDNWLVKYRPKNLSEYVFNDEILESVIRTVVKTKVPVDVIFTGHYGTGKTSLAHALVGEMGIQDFDFMRVNVSDKGIDAFRNEIRNFCSVSPLGAFKICLLDEVDGSSPEVQNLLRGFMDEFLGDVMFILTCNNPSRVIEPIRNSRGGLFNFNKINYEGTVEMLAKILHTENVEFDEESLIGLIDRFSPDIRSMIKWAQLWSTSGKLILEEVPTTGLQEFAEMYINGIQNTGNWQSMLLSLMNAIKTSDDWIRFYNYMGNEVIPNSGQSDDIIRTHTLITAEHAFRLGFMAASPELLASSYIINLRV